MHKITNFKDTPSNVERGYTLARVVRNRAEVLTRVAVDRGGGTTVHAGGHNIGGARHY